MTSNQKFNIPVAKLLITLVSLVACILVPFEVLDYLGIASVLTIGLLHGANDIMLINKDSELQKRSLSTVHAILYYSGVVLGFTLLFYLMPILGLLFFIGISAIHFGEQHLAIKSKATPKSLQYLIYFMYGLTVFMLIFYFNEEATTEIIQLMTGIKLSSLAFTYGLIGSVLGTLLLFLFMTFVQKTFTWAQIVYEILILLLLGMTFNYANLLFSFAVYFVIWHSIPSMRDQLKFIYGNVSVQSVKQYIRHAFIFWFVSLMGLLIFLYFIKEREELFLAVFFSFLAAITLPHVLIIAKIKQRE